MPTSVWTPEMDACAARLRREGVSARVIAARFGVSRSAVLGRLWRLGVSAEFGPKPKRRAAEPAAGPPVAQTAVACRPRPWLTRARGECAYPVAGDGPDLWSCCNPCGSQTYCPEHRAAVYPARDQAEAA